jgi:hypothetical protein
MTASPSQVVRQHDRLGDAVRRAGEHSERPVLSVAHFERDGTARASTIEAIKRALENAGIIFIDANEGGHGARLRHDYGEPRAKL